MVRGSWSPSSGTPENFFAQSSTPSLHSGSASPPQPGEAPAPQFQKVQLGPLLQPGGFYTPCSSERPNKGGHLHGTPENIPETPTVFPIFLKEKSLIREGRTGTIAVGRGFVNPFAEFGSFFLRTEGKFISII